MNNRKAFTLVELLVVISIIALLVGILLPALSRARDAAMVNSSKNNIRNVFMANQNYNSANKGRQFVGAPSDLARYGNDIGSAIAGYEQAFALYGEGDQFGGWAPGPGVQFGETQNGTVVFPGNVPEYIVPILFNSGPTSTQSAPGYGTRPARLERRRGTRLSAVGGACSSRRLATAACEQRGEGHDGESRRRCTHRGRRRGCAAPASSLACAQSCKVIE